MVSLQHFRNYQLPILKILKILIWLAPRYAIRQNHLQNPHKQSLNNILKNPNFPQTIIQQHPENPLILDILIQTKSSPKSHKQSLNNILKNPNFPQTIIQQHPVNP
jgi:hypothetical protein